MQAASWLTRLARPVGGLAERVGFGEHLDIDVGNPTSACHGGEGTQVWTPGRQTCLALLLRPTFEALSVPTKSVVVGLVNDAVPEKVALHGTCATPADTPVALSASEPQTATGAVGDHTLLGDHHERSHRSWTWPRL